MKLSAKTKFKLNTLGGNSSNSCNQEMSPNHTINIVTYKSIFELKAGKNKSLPSICIIWNIQNIDRHIIWKNKPKYITMLPKWKRIHKI